MASYLFANHLLLRAPVANEQLYQQEPQYFLKDPFFQAALYLASPTFFTSLERAGMETDSLSEKQMHTLRKYINRYCYRPTPFGLFSSVTLGEWSPGISREPSGTNLIPYIRPGMTPQLLLSRMMLTNELYAKSTFQSNPSLYRVLNEYRFIRTELDETTQLREYQLQSIAYSRLLKDLISSGENGYTRQALVTEISRFAACSETEAADYADFLIEAQLMVNRYRPTITGRNYLAHLVPMVQEGITKVKLLNFMPTQIRPLKAMSPALMRSLEKKLAGILPHASFSTGKWNIILQNDSKTSLSTHYQLSIRAALDALELLLPSGRSPAMTRFIATFQEHFGGQTLPLLLAMDPEAGIGYQQPEMEKNNPLLETLHISSVTPAEPSGRWGATHRLLMEAWLRDKTTFPVIRLENTDLDQLRSETGVEQILGLSVLFRTIGKKIFIENAGGINAPALMGRFTVADRRIAAAARAMAQYLEKQNPDLIFAELLHLADPHTDNINCREHIYDIELPVTAASVLPKNKQIPLSDLYLKVENNMVLLFSEKHQKVVIPRLTTAYNHSLNKLPIFRFLADLPFQYGRSNFGFDLRQFFPDLHFYPRVEYKENILSLATWVITATQLDELRTNDPKNQVAAFKLLSSLIGLPRYFSLSEGDQELVFDGKNGKDIALFCDCIRQKKETVLKEFLKQPMVRQYNAFLLPAEPLVLPALTKRKKNRVRVQRKYMPGSEWLYLKIYAPKTGLNSLLLQLRPMFRKYCRQGKVLQWFFIRYEDHAPHIRLRLKTHLDWISEILQAIKSKLEYRIQRHIIREYQIDVYSRELERYGAGGIENTERFFWASSELVLYFFNRQKTGHAFGNYQFALYSTRAMIGLFINDTEEQIAFALSSFQQFLIEFKDAHVRVELDKKYRELTTDIIAVMQQSDPGLLSGSVKAGSLFRKSLRDIREYMILQTDRTSYLRSIIHMHLNRIFTDAPRKQEMIIYYLLYKYLLSVKGRKKQSAE